MLIDHGGGVWTAGSDMRFPGLVWLPLRMTVIRMSTGELWVCSPIALDPALADEVAALGPVRWLVGPNLLHHLHLRAWSERFPEAELWGSPGLADKRKNLRFTGTCGGETDPWRAEIESIAIQGSPKIGEVVFFHRASHTLVVADLLFNILVTRGFGTPWLLRMMGTYRRFAQSRVWRFSVGDRSALAHSGRKVAALPAKRVVVAHGEVITALAPGALEHALAWMCNDPKALPSPA